MSDWKKIPMSTEEIQELFLNTSKHYTIDLKNSALKGEAFITYISNMQMNCSLAIDETVPSEEKFEILRLFLTSRQTIKCDTLLNTTALLLLKSRNVDVQNSIGWLSFDEVKLFIEQNKSLIDDISDFIDSMPLTATCFNTEIKEEYLVPAIEKGEVEVITDLEAIGVNILALMGITDFLEFSLAANPNPNTKMRYYQPQVERLTYDKQTIFDIFFKREDPSFLMSMVNILFSSGEQEVKLMQDYLEI
jgi:hypothetical protein